ncbi:MAG: sensor histidine kinase [Nocardioidaceae bacterium]
MDAEVHRKLQTPAQAPIHGALRVEPGYRDRIEPQQPHAAHLAGHPADPSPVLRTMQIGQHVLFVLLLTIGSVRATISTSHPVALVAGIVAFAVWYAVGVWLALRHRDRLTGLLWLSVLVLGWLALVYASDEFSWVAFSLFFLALHLLPLVPAVASVAVLTAVVVFSQLTTGDTNAVAKIIGPSIGAVVAIGMSLAYRRLAAESEHRRRLVEQLVTAQDDLVTTHDELVATQREAGALAERARLARDIHDTLAQGFSSILLLARAGLADTTQDAQALLGQIESTATDNLEEARRVVHALAPAALESAPLAAAIRRLLDRLSEQAGVAIDLTVDQSDPRAATAVPTAYDVALLRLAQSALANVRQHSGAQRVAVSLTYAPDAVSLDVVDDGSGFDLSALESAPLGGTGFGLRAMRERLADLDGHLTVESAAGEGTAVVAVLPLTSPTDAT